jgi:hypothetical protein
MFSPRAVRSLAYCLPLWLLALSCAPLQAEPFYNRAGIHFTLGQDARVDLDPWTGTDVLRPGFRNDVQRGTALQLDIRSRQRTGGLEDENPIHTLETTGALLHTSGRGHLGYGLDIGLHLHLAPSLAEPSRWSALDAVRSPRIVTNFSAGPVYQSGNLTSRVRLGYRYPLGEMDLDGQKNAASEIDRLERSGGFVRLDGQLRLRKEAELSWSLFYDDLGRHLSLPGAMEGGSFWSPRQDPDRSWLGIEMGLNF